MFNLYIHHYNIKFDLKSNSYLFPKRKTLNIHVVHWMNTEDKWIYKKQKISGQLATVQGTLGSFERSINIVFSSSHLLLAEI